MKRPVVYEVIVPEVGRVVQFERDVVLDTRCEVGYVFIERVRVFQLARIETETAI
jgi:hypothetical protein